MATGGHPAGTAGGQSFDLATAVAGGPERWTAEVDPGWTVAGRPNGGTCWRWWGERGWRRLGSRIRWR